MAEGRQNDKDRVVGFTCSTFDLMHAGHAEFLRECRERCDRLVVGLQTQIPDRPGKNQPVQTVLERFLVLRACRYVDEIVPYESEKDLENLLKTLGPHYRFLGSDYSCAGDEEQFKPITSQELYFDDGYELSFVPRDHDYSTSALRHRVFLAESINREKLSGGTDDGSGMDEGGQASPWDARGPRRGQ
jgi:glycerol-3-phosphate cytidylyltransferase